MDAQLYLGTEPPFPVPRARCVLVKRKHPGPNVAKGLQPATDLGNVNPNKEQFPTVMLKLHDQAVSIRPKRNYELALRSDAMILQMLAWIQHVQSKE